jgi:hypothetical protein
VNDTVRGVVDAIIENRRRFEAFCHSLSEEQLARRVPDSTWLVRDFAAHLGTLDTALLRWFGAVPVVADGGPPVAATDEDGEPFDVDAFNDAQVAARREWTLDQVFAEASANREKLVTLLGGLTQEQIDRPMHFGGDAKRPAGDIPLKTFLAGWAQHDPIHVADMLKALPELQDDPELRAWLDNPFVVGYQAIMNRPGHG